MTTQSAIVAIVSAALAAASCTAQPSGTTSHAGQGGAAPAAPAVQTRYDRSDFVGNWACTVTNGQVTVSTKSTIRADGTALGQGTAYGRTTPVYENSWYYVATGPTTGVMRSNNLSFAPPHYSAAAAVTWHDHNQFSMVTQADTNARSVGTRMTCLRR